jgi:arylsulfatase A-like enzyme
MNVLLPLLLLAGPSLPAQEPDDARPDVFVIIADDFGLSDLALIDTPHLDALAARGVSFSRAYANPMCTPSRHSFLFGVWSDSGLGDPCDPDQPPFDRGAFTLAKMMDVAGYETALLGKCHLGGNELGPYELTPHLFGFETWRAGVPANVVRCGGKDYFEWTRVDDGVSGLSKQYQTDAVREVFRESRAAQTGPQFVVLSLQTPHGPMHVPPRFADQEARTNRQKYVLMVRDMDALIGELLGPGGIDLEEDLVFFFGDNGTPPGCLGPGQTPGKVKFTVFEGGVKVPMLVAGKGIESRGSSDALIHVVDVAATIADLLGLDAPPGDGVSFRYALDDPDQPSRRDHVYFSRPRWPAEKAKPGERGVVSRRLKLREHAGRLELYDLEEDPGETLDVSGKEGYAGELERMKAFLAQHPLERGP